MTNKEAIKLLQSIEEDGFNVTAEHLDALDLAIKALEDVERLEEENHSNFVNSQHIISSLIEEIKKLRGEE